MYAALTIENRHLNRWLKRLTGRQLNTKEPQEILRLFCYLLVSPLRVGQLVAVGVDFEY
ncbi:hypothetical protein NT6N_00650 [Oceaniferula spumae]|uniref:Uncharacterized protein n=1 Tax=Oceaniferula spumae TaxID=2979115 RepID=A0AAT9FGB3_9BACT